MRKARVAVFISGTGSNLSALLDCRDHLDVVLVFSQRSQAYGLQRARRRGVPVVVMSNPIDWNSLIQRLQEVSADYIFLGGFMKILPESFIQAWEGRIFNIHPSLLPLYPGLRSIARAVEANGPFGVTLHGVVPEVDAGPVLFQDRIEMQDVKSLEEIEFLYHVREHRLVREWGRLAGQI